MKMRINFTYTLNLEINSGDFHTLKSVPLEEINSGDVY